MIFGFAKTVLANLFNKPATLMYPVVAREFYPNTRGSIAFDKDSCTYCTLCQKKCPTHAITVDRAEKIWSIEEKKCITCNACVDCCPKNSLTMANQYKAPIMALRHN